MIPVVCAILRRGERILAARRKAGLARGGFWEFPGGKVEADEDPAEALKREIAEEFCCQCGVGKKLLEASHDYGDLSIQLMAFEAELKGPIAALADHDALAWMSPASLSRLVFAPADIPILQGLLEERSR